MKAWMTVALYPIWRCGMPKKDDLVDRFQAIDLPIDEIYQGLIAEKLIVLRVKSEQVFVQLTDKGFDFICAAEEPLWRAQFKGVVHTTDVIRPRAKQAFELQHKQKMTLRQVADTLKCSPSHAQAMIKQYERVTTRYAQYNQAVQKFVAGEIRFKDLKIDVFGEISVRLANGLERSEIYTVPQLLNMTALSFLRTKNFGRMTIKEINAVLKRYGTRLEPGGFDYRWLKD